jgi:hypothetical protein
LPASVAIDPEHWRKRAEEARDLADRMSDPLAKELMLRIAEDYERLAEREPKNGKIWPQNTKEVTRYASPEGVAQRMSVRGPYTNPSSKHGRRTCKGPVRRPEWSAQALVAVIPAILSCSPSAGNPARTTGARRRFRQLLTLARVASHTCPQYHQLPKGTISSYHRIGWRRSYIRRAGWALDACDFVCE